MPSVPPGMNTIAGSIALSATPGAIAAGRRDPSALATREYFDELEPIFTELRGECDRLLALNHGAMRRKAAEAAALARRWFLATLLLALALVLAGSWFAIVLSNSIVRPVRQLSVAAGRMAAGDLDSVVDVRSGDEIGDLAVQFNAMAARVRELRQSDLGKILVAQQTAEATVDSLYDPVIVTDAAGRVQRINRAAEVLFGPADTVLGKPLQNVATDPRLAAAVADVLESARPVASEETAAIVPLRVDGIERSFRQRTTPMRDADGALVGAVILLEDITHLRELDRLKSEFIAGASHELRTPLTSFEMGVHLLLEGSLGDLSAKQRELLVMCRDDALRLDTSGEAVARSLEDRVRGGASPVRAGQSRRVDRRCSRAAAAAGRRQGAHPPHRRASRSARDCSRSWPGRTRDHQSRDQRHPRDRCRRDDRDFRGAAQRPRRDLGA